jgi:hypothetical protein
LVVLIILLALILLIFFVPYGIDAAYENGQPRLCVRAGPFSIRLYPKKPKTEKQLEKERRKKEKKAAKDAAKKEEREKKEPEAEEETQAGDETIKVKKQRQLDLDTILALLEMGVKAIRRFFRSFTVNYFKLHCTMAGSDPYNTAMGYGYLCSAVEGLRGLSEDRITLQRRDIALDADFTSEKPIVDVRIIITLQLFKIVHLAAAFGVEYLIWTIKNRREKKAAAAEERE